MLMYAKWHENWSENQWQQINPNVKIFKQINVDLDSNHHQHVRERSGERYKSKFLQPSVKTEAYRDREQNKM